MLKKLNTPLFRAAFIFLFSVITFHWWGYSNYSYVYHDFGWSAVDVVVVDRVDSMTRGKYPKQRFILIIDVVDENVPNVRTSVDVSPATWYSAKVGEVRTFNLRYTQLYPSNHASNLVEFGIVITGAIGFMLLLAFVAWLFWIVITYKANYE